MSVRSPAEHENADLRHAGMDSLHPGCSGDIYVNLDSSTPCWNDARSSLRVTEALLTRIFKRELIGRAERPIDHESFSSLLA
jgi:hypothetical protein